ncbi:MAG: IPT/TIG domain-containing protein [Hymenobacter sp.]|nr:IPT/TIG domain-containing protein [Hymenobacter sp.]
MKNNLFLRVLPSLALLLGACDSGDEDIQQTIRISDITPGTTMIGGSTLNTAVIGDTITISGERFSVVAAENLVSIQEIPVPVLAASSTTIQVMVPPRVPFSYVDVVVARAGYEPAVRQISVRSSPSPLITGIRPTTGPVGTVVTILGKNLDETLENAVAFPNATGQAAMLFIRPINPILATSDSIQIAIPAGAGTGKISLYARPAENVANSFGSIVTPTFTVTP